MALSVINITIIVFYNNSYSINPLLILPYVYYDFVIWYLYNN